jgi:hypothetical protein
MHPIILGRGVLVPVHDLELHRAPSRHGILTAVGLLDLRDPPEFVTLTTMRSTLSPLGDLSLPMMPDAAACVKWVKGSIERHMERYYDSKRNVTRSVGKVLEEKLALAEQDPEDYPTACQRAGVLVDEHDSISISKGR